MVDNSTGEAAHAGSWKAWMDGYGTTHTDTLSQSVTIPAGCHATLTFYLHIDTAETDHHHAYDKLTVKAGSTTLATYSNLNTAHRLRAEDLRPSPGRSDRHDQLHRRRGLLAADLVRHRRHRGDPVLIRSIASNRVPVIV